jgi:hypothetical protein
LESFAEKLGASSKESKQLSKMTFQNAGDQRLVLEIKMIKKNLEYKVLKTYNDFIELEQYIQREFVY